MAELKSRFKRGQMAAFASVFPRKLVRAKRGTTIRIIFDANVAASVAARKWFRTQKIDRLPNGRIALSATVPSLVGLDRWVLSWSGSASVAGPARLRKRVREIATVIMMQSGVGAS